MRLFEIYTNEALKPSEYRPLVKGWDKERYADIFKNPEYKHDKNGYRVYIPLDYRLKKKSKIQRELEDELIDHGFDMVDYQKGLVKNKKNDQTVKIGKVLNKLGKTELLNKYTSDEAREGTKGEYMVVISRHPYDIAGMSTDRGWTSCMNLKNGINKEYVPLEIDVGTVIAYVTFIDDPDLKNPSGRVLIKPFVNVLDEDNKSFIYFGIEDSVYGTAIPGFLDAVSKWVNEINQKHELDDVALVRLNDKSYPDGDGITNTKVIGSSKDSTEKEQIKQITYDPLFIRDIDDPTEKVQLLVVNIDPVYIKYIKNPTEKTQLAAVKKRPSTIGYIKNPTIEAQVIAVSEEPLLINSMSNPSEEVQMTAISQNAAFIKFIADPTMKIQKLVIREQPKLIFNINHPSEEIQLFALNQDPDSFKYIRNPTEKVEKLYKKLKARK